MKDSGVSWAIWKRRRTRAGRGTMASLEPRQERRDNGYIALQASGYSGSRIKSSSIAFPTCQRIDQSPKPRRVVIYIPQANMQGPRNIGRSFALGYWWSLARHWQAMMSDIA
jgi:hypothetical protein